MIDREMPAGINKRYRSFKIHGRYEELYPLVTQYRRLNSVLLAEGQALLALIFPKAACDMLIPSCDLPTVLETPATCLPAHQVQDSGGDPSTFLSAD
jgi:hypothetical protein